MMDDVIRAVGESESLMVSEMCEMIRIPAMAPENGGNGECARADVIQHFLKGFDSVKRYDTPDPKYPDVMRANVVAIKKGKKKGTAWFIAHMDTVPTGDPDKWKYGPFNPIVVDGKIYGRGTEDNGQSLIGLAAASEIVCKEEFNGMSLGVIFVADEETGSLCGIRHLIDVGLFSKDDFIMVPDWGSPGGSMVNVDEKQILWMKVNVIGKETHAATPNKGINAYRVATEFQTDLIKRLEEKYSYEDPLFRPPNSTFEPTKACANEGSVNMIPGDYEFYIDCRILPKYGIDEIFQFSKSVASEHSERTGAKITVQDVQKNLPGRRTSTDTEGYRKLQESVKAVKGIDIEPVGIGGGTCANFFRLEGFDAYVWGSDGGTLHRPDEYVVIDTMVEDAKVFAALMYKLCVE